MSTTTVASPSEQLQQRLNDPKTVESLNRLLDHLDTVSFAVESLEGFISRGEVIVDSVASGVDELKNSGDRKTLELIQKGPQLLETGTKLADAAGELDVEQLVESKVLQRLSDPDTLRSLNQLLDRLPLAAFLMESLEGFISRGDTIAENLASAVGELNLTDSKIDTDQIKLIIESLPKFREAGEKLLESELIGDGLPKVIDAGVSMIESGMLDAEVVALLGDLGKKSAETYREVSANPVEPVGGLWATLKATKDPDVQKSVGFFLAFAKAFAKHLK